MTLFVFFWLSLRCVFANYSFSPTGGTVVLGSQVSGATNAVALQEGTSVGSWKGALADDNFHWVIERTVAGYNAFFDIDNVTGNGANSILVQTEFYLDVSPTIVQICDWVSSAQVDSPADSVCTNGGWRTLNNRKAPITTTLATAYQWQVYNGYWDVETPISYFINSSASKKVRIRYISSGAGNVSQISIDYLRIQLVINPIYQASSFVNLGSGTTNGTYRNTNAIYQGASDNILSGAGGTTNSVADFYFSFDNIKTYSEMNTILVRAEHRCNITDNLVGYKPKIYNFSNSSWEDLTTNEILCSSADKTNAWAKNNIKINDYIDPVLKKIRVGFRSTTNTTAMILIDFIYITLGTTNTDLKLCEISIGTTGSVGTNCGSTRNLDTTGVGETWVISTEDESYNTAKDYYPFDHDMDSTTNEEAAAGHVKFKIAPPDGGVVTSMFFAGRFQAGAAGTIQLGMRDYSGKSNTNGGFSPIGGSATTSLVYTDNVTVGSIANGGMGGYWDNADKYIDTLRQEAWVRLRTNLDGPSSVNSVVSWDFAMISYQWVEDLDHISKTYQFSPSAGNIVVGTTVAITSRNAALAEGVNTGSWKATLADDDFHWVISSTTNGLNTYLDTDYVQLNGANSLIVQSKFDLDATAPSVLVQICDWVSSVGVDNNADSECTDGGWRTLNTRNIAITTLSPSAYQWQIYDGYWNTPTPLKNFINRSKAANKTRIRFFSTVNTTSQISIDFLNLQAIVSPIYQASSFVNLGTGSSINTYRETTNFGQDGSDNEYAMAAGTLLSVADFYFSFDNVKTNTSMNTILVRAEHSCSVSNPGFRYRPKIFNFTLNSWEHLSNTDILCTQVDRQDAWSKNKIQISDYVSNGKIRVGFVGVNNFNAKIRVDMIYVMLGITNNNIDNCEISYGSGDATKCDNTRNLDTTSVLGLGSSWNIATKDESAVETSTPYALDWDGDANIEEAAAAGIKVGVQVAQHTNLVSIFNAFRFNTQIGATATIKIRDYSGKVNTTGGFSAISIGATASDNMVYIDNLTLGGIGTGGWSGFGSNASSYVNTQTNEAWMQLVTTSDGDMQNNATYSIDFAFFSFAWIEPGYSVVGNVYSDEGQTKYSCNLDNLTISARLNGSELFQGACVDSSAYYVITDIGTTTSGDVLTVYIDNETPKANIVTKLNGQSRSVFDMDLYKDRVVLRHEDLGPITNYDLAKYDFVADSDIFYKINSTNNGYEGVNGSKLFLGIGKTYIPSGNISTPSFYIGGYFDLNGKTLALRSGGNNLDCSTADSFVIPLCIGVNGSANFDNGSVNYEGQIGTTVYSHNYNNLGIGTSSELSIGTTFTLIGNIDISGTLTLGGVNSSGIDILDMTNSTINLKQGANPVVKNFGNISGNGTVNYVSPVNTNLASLNYYNLGVGTSSETGIGATYIINTGITVANVVAIGNSSSTFTDTLYGGTGNITLLLSGDPWDIKTKGAFLPGTGTVSYRGNSNTTIERMDYYNLDISPNNGTPIYSFTGNGDVKVQNDFSIGGLGNVLFDVETQDVNIDIDNNFILGAGDTYAASSTANLSIGGSINIDGIFRRNNSTLTLDTADKVSVLTYGIGQTFFNLNIGVTGKTVRFDSIDRTVVTNNFTVNNGNVCDKPVLLYSETDGNQWDLQVLGLANVNFAQIKDSNAIVSATANNTLSLGNNTNWTVNGGVCNIAPSSPTALSQKKTDGTNLIVGSWVNKDTLEFSANATDPNISDTLQLCVEKKKLGNIFAGSEDACGMGVSYTGNPVGVAVTVPLISEGEYHWQVRIKDAGGLYSFWTSFDSNLETVRDFGIDTTPPTGGIVYDGNQPGIDLNYNSGGLDTLYANWNGINANMSGLEKVEFAVGSGVGETNIVSWTSAGVGTSAVITGLSLNTSSKYFFTIKATDLAGNIGSTVVSNGLAVAPTLIFSASPNTVTFTNLNVGNNYTATANTNLNVSTNAYNGYVIRAYTSGLLQSGSYNIPNFNGGSYSITDGWLNSDRGFGYTSSDNDIDGNNKFNPPVCLGGNTGPCWAPFSQTSPGDIVADHTTVIQGTPVTNESYTIGYKVQTDNTQPAANYSTTIIYTIVPKY